jgi:hypothetical protein
MLRSTLVASAAILSMNGAVGAQTVTFDDLKGASIAGTVVQVRNFRSGEKSGTHRATQQMKVSVGKDGKIAHTQTVTIALLSGGRVGTNVHSGIFTLEKPQKFRDGSAVFVFSEGSLVRLRTIDAGGQKVIFAFTRQGDKINCKIDMPFAREDGKGALRTTSSVTGKATVFLSSRQVSSDCRVTRP